MVSMWAMPGAREGVKNRGWCQKAMMQWALVAARSLFSHCSCGVPREQPPAAAQVLLRAIRCHDPTSKE